MLRDACLLLLAILLIGWPGTINRMLVAAGFEEGSFAGIKWKAKLEKSDQTLLEAQTTISDLQAQNNSLGQALSKAKTQMPSEQTRADISRLEALNTQLEASASRAQVSVQAALAANAPLVQKIQSATGTVITWGVVLGGDRKLADAQHEITVVKRLGLTNAAIYYRQGWYRSVVTSSNRLQAEQLVKKAKERRAGSYIVNMSTWCPSTTSEGSYFVCSDA